MHFKRRKFEHTHINIAPLVDVVFLLLLFFMLTSHLMQEPAIKIKLPQSKTAEVVKDDPKTIYISKNGEIYYKDTLVALKDLQTVLKSTLKGTDDEFIRIKADKESDVGVLISVIDEVRLAGIRNYSIVTERK